MTVRKEPSGRFRAVLKVGREYVEGRTFDTKRDAQAWLARERAALAGGVCAFFLIRIEGAKPGQANS